MGVRRMRREMPWWALLAMFIACAGLVVWIAVQ